MKNRDVIVGIVLIIITIGVIVALTSTESDVFVVEDTLDRELKPVEEISPEIQERLDEIEKQNIENEYKPKDREWITSGPFQIDRSEYVLGEKIFLRIGGLDFEDKGQIVFLKPKNNTHYEVYWSIPFDGSDNTTFNYYLQPQLSANKGYCTVEEFIGEWRVVFRGTDYSNLEFRITEEILPGDEEDYEPVC